jgi:ribokinase
VGRVVVVGSSNMDLTVVARTLPAPGETVLGRSVASGPGGKGANQAIAARRLGAGVTFVTKLGRDRAGSDLRALFEREGLPSTGILETEDAPTGVASIIVDDAGRNMIAVVPGANALLSPTDLDGLPGWLDGASHLLVQLETPVETFVHAARLAREAGVVVALDPAPATAVPNDVYRLIDILMPNEVELAVLTGLPTGDPDRVEAAARHLQDRGVVTVIVTLGARGSVCLGPAGIIRTTAPEIEALDTTGCGDAFAGALVAALGQNAGVSAALRLATRAGAFCATRRGVLDGLPTRSDLDRELPA